MRWLFDILYVYSFEPPFPLFPVCQIHKRCIFEQGMAVSTKCKRPYSIASLVRPWVQYESTIRVYKIFIDFNFVFVWMNSILHYSSTGYCTRIYTNCCYSGDFFLERFSCKTNQIFQLFQWIDLLQSIVDYGVWLMAALEFVADYWIEFVWVSELWWFGGGFSIT